MTADDLDIVIAGSSGTPRHAAPEIGFDPDTDPGCHRAGWIADHPDRTVPDRIGSHGYPEHLTGGDRMGGGQDPMSDYLYLKGELA